ncbi:hypothetical protein QF023_002498 [Chryseobacterium sp. SLBN-27]|uniref:hypothetical protein n=1 Tax=Chryseobacterium sp. SLBN-27 TaxID=3042287 RepID=UPI0028603CE9|nr:hypothetical protein [Chryseobacterium sp. SLBN-27]MDR6158982.1 hypothetical protein [Chryseobacterium sp. SLBN-27]
MKILKSLFIAILFCFALWSCKKQKATTETKDNVSTLPIDTTKTNTDNPIFKEFIPAYVEGQYAKKFEEVASKHPNLLKAFALDYPAFKELIEDHDNYKYAKFYFIQDSANSKINLGLAFSNNDNYKDISLDDKFVLINNKFQGDEKLQEKIKFYQSSLAAQTGFNNKPATECILYTISEIANYFSVVQIKNISQLDLTMIYFCQATESNGNEYNRYADKYDRISFAVHAVYSDGSVDLGYDAGDLKP